MRIKSSFLAFLICIPPLLTACDKRVDLKAVRDFASLATRAEQSFPEIANDFYGSCLRDARYQPIGQLNEADVANLRSLLNERFLNQAEPEKQKLKEEIETLLSNLPTRQDPLANRKLRVKICEDYKGLGDDLIARHRVLFAYIQSLGALAGDDVIDYSQDFENLGRSINNVTTTLKLNISEDDVKVSAKIISNILSAFQDNTRRKELKAFLLDNEAAVDTYLDSLQFDIRAYSITLAAEEGNLDAYFQTALLSEIAYRQTTSNKLDKVISLMSVAAPNSSQTNSPTNFSAKFFPESVLSIDTKYADAKQEIAKRYATAEAYKEILVALQKANHEFACMLQDKKGQIPPDGRPCETPQAKVTPEAVRGVAAKYYQQLLPLIRKMERNL